MCQRYNNNHLKIIQVDIDAFWGGKKKKKDLEPDHRGERWAKTVKKK